MNYTIHIVLLVIVIITSISVFEIVLILTSFQAAKRELAEECGSKLQVTFLGNAPFAYLSYKHPGKESVIGSKVSEFKVLLKAHHPCTPKSQLH